MAAPRIPKMITADMQTPQTHSKVIGYFLWLYDFCTLNGQIDERNAGR